MKWNQLIPELDVFSLTESLEFYTKLLGFNIMYTREEDKLHLLKWKKFN